MATSTVTKPTTPGRRVRSGKGPRPRPLAPASSSPTRGALPWLLLSLFLTLLPLVGQVPTWTLALFGGCTAWRYWLERSDRSLPPLLLRLLLFVPVALLILRTYGTHPSATGMLAFLIALLSLKVLELRTLRDFTIVAVLGYFMVLSALFYEQSFGLCLYLAGVVLLNSAALIRCHGGVRSTWPTVRLALSMGLQALPLVVLLFVIFPRVQGTFLRGLGTGNKGQTGMSDHLQPGSFSSLAQSNDLAFRALIVSKKPVTQGQLYWRGLVLEVCEQSLSWVATPQPAGLNNPAPTVAPDDLIEQKITLLSTGDRWLFALDRPTGMKPVGDLRADYLRTQTLHSHTPIDGTVNYTAFSSLNLPVPKALSPYQRNLDLTLPSDQNPRALELARSWRRNAHSEGEIVQAAERFFKTGHFAYTLTPGLLPREAPLDFFLFTSRRGFCEHYAAAYSTLMRAAGIPARIVLGYQGGEYNQFGKRYVVLQSDAHAWSEVWLEGRGWVREDPTGFVAPDRVSYGMENYAALDGAFTDAMRLERLNALNAGPWRWLTHNGAQLWDAADEQWNQLILGYDQNAQFTVMEKLGVGNMSAVAQVALATAAAFFLLGLVAVAVQMFGRSAPKADDPVRRLYERFLRETRPAGGTAAGGGGRSAGLCAARRGGGAHRAGGHHADHGTLRSFPVRQGRREEFSGNAARGGAALPGSARGRAARPLNPARRKSLDEGDFRSRSSRHAKPHSTSP